MGRRLRRGVKKGRNYNVQIASYRKSQDVQNRGFSQLYFFFLIYF